MASESERIRQLMDLLEGSAKPQFLAEGWVQNLRDKKIKNLGNKERQEMAKRLKQEWLKWLGQTGRDGTMGDMERFMQVRIGFTDDDVSHVMNRVYTTEPEADAEQEVEKTIARGEPETKKDPEWDPEEGVPLPTDLNAKLSDFAHYGIDVEKNDNKTEPGEIVDDPRKYKLADGSWDRKKITAKLGKMPMGDKLTLGTSTFSRGVGKSEDQSADRKQAAESVMEDEAEGAVLDKDDVNDIMDASAARINDNYLLNGPRNDQDELAANAAAQGLGGKGRATASPNRPGKQASGQYDAAEMFAILKTDFQKSPAWVASLTRKVMDADSISKMADSDMDDLALLGWALVRARN